MKGRTPPSAATATPNITQLTKPAPNRRVKLAAVPDFAGSRVTGRSSHRQTDPKATAAGAKTRVAQTCVPGLSRKGLDGKPKLNNAPTPRAVRPADQATRPRGDWVCTT